jgi:predicted SAM-dependent methyltransferase
MRNRPTEPGRMKALNLGCGRRAHSEWENVDLFPASPIVRAHDLRKGIPYSDGTFDVVYHSHLLEHFQKHAGLGFLGECHRVLKSGGVIRVAVPDLEQIVRLYLKALENATRGVPEWRENYEWMILELLDQMVREMPGGLCIEYRRQKPIPNWSFIRQRWGTEAEAAVEAFQAEARSHENGHGRPHAKEGFTFRHFAKFLVNRLATALLSEENYEVLRVAWFRKKGEIHRWMYDAYSLAQLLRRAGFSDCQRRTATESQIPNWMEYQLDCEPDGTVYKPDSLFMEAVKL